MSAETQASDWPTDPRLMQQSMLHVMLIDPLALLEYLLPRARWSRVPEERRYEPGRLCLLDHVRRNMCYPGSEVSPALFERIECVLRRREPHHVALTLMALMDVDVDVYQFVASTFPGSPEAFEKIMAYLYRKLLFVVRAPWFPSTARRITYGVFIEVRQVVCHGNVPRILLECLPIVEKTSCPRTKRGRTADPAEDAETDDEDGARWAAALEAAHAGLPVAET